MQLPMADTDPANSNGMIAGLVAITPAAGFVPGWASIVMGAFSGSIPWVRSELPVSANMDLTDDLAHYEHPWQGLYTPMTITRLEV